MVHRTHGEQSGYGQGGLLAEAVDGAIRQDHHHLARLHRRHRVLRQLVQRGFEIAQGRIVLQVEMHRGEGRIAAGGDRLVAVVGQHGRIQLQTVCVQRRLFEQVAFAPEHGVERHDDGFADRIDRRIGHLRELLPQIVERRTHLLGQHRHGRVVAHGADGFLALFGQHADHLVQFLGAEIEQLLVGRHRGGIHGRIIRVLLHAELDPLRVGLEPVAVRLGALELGVDVLGQEESPGLQIGRYHLARTHAPLGGDVVGAAVIPNAHFRGDGHIAILGDHVARRAQAIAVQHAHAIAAVGHDDAGGAIPGLHVHGVVFVEGAQVRVHVGHVLPGRRHHHAHGAEQTGAAHDQAFEHVVEAHRVRALDAHHRPHVVHVGDQGALEFLLARARPVAVALHGIDLAVVGEVAERLAQAPLRPGVGGKALVEHGERRGEARVGEIRIEHLQIGRHHQALVGNHPPGQGRHVEGGIRVGHCLLHAAPGDIELALEDVGRDVLRTVHEELLDHRQALQGDLAECGVVRGHRTETGHVQACAGQLPDQQLARARGQGRILVEKGQAGGITGVQGVAVLDRHRAQETVRFLEQQTTAVARFAIGSHRAAVSHASQRRDRRGHQLVGCLVIQLRNQAESAAILLEVRAVQRAS